jgi:hypothetical protein
VRGGKEGGVPRSSRAEYILKRRVAPTDQAVVYKAYRVHTTPHLAGLWISLLVSIGAPKPVTQDSLTDTVTRVPGEYPSAAQALAAAKRYIDDEASRQPGIDNAPASGDTDQGQ